jgi:hypothetical protein
LQKVVKPLPGVVKKLPVPLPPGGLGLPKALGSLPGETLALPNKALGGIGGV